MREERKKLDLDSVEGQKRVQEINANLDKNTEKIKANVSALEKQKINIGNYKSALEGVIPGLSNVSAGVEKASGAVKLFRLALGPVGIVLGLIAGALALLGKYLFGTQEGMDKVTAVTRPLLAIFNRLTGVVEILGGKLFRALGDAIQNPIQALKDLGQAIVDNVLNRFKALSLIGPALAKIFSGDVTNGFKDLGDAAIQAVAGIENGIDKITSAARATKDFIDNAIDEGKRLDDIQKLIERGEVTRITRSKELELIEKRNKGIVEDETKSLAEREAAAIRARNAQNTNEKEALNLIDLRIERLKILQHQNDTNIDDEKELAELVATRLETQARTAERAIEFDKKLNELRKKQAIEFEKELTAKQVDEAATRRANNVSSVVEETDALVNVFESRAVKLTDITERMNKELADINKYWADKQEAERKRNAELAIQIEDDKQQAISSILASGASVFRQQSAAYKILATGSALISTYAAATKAYEAAFLPVPTIASPALGALFAAAAIAQGLANVAAINNVQFSEGGWTGPGGKYVPAGTVHKGEVVWNQEDVAMAGGPAAANAMRPTAKYRNALSGQYFDGGLGTALVTQPINQQLEISNIMKNLPPQVVSVEEFNRVAKRVAVKEQFSRR